MPETFAAFVSYSHKDDEYDDGAITKLAERLEGALRAYTGRQDVGVFLDRRAIGWGDAWRSRIEQGVGSSAALIAVVTPRYLESLECRREFETFERESGADRWFLPLHYIEVDSDTLKNNALARAIFDHEYLDWRALRDAGPASTEVRKALEEIARRIRDLLRAAAKADTNEMGPPPEPSRMFRAHTVGERADEDWLDAAIAAQAAIDDDEYGLARAVLLDALDSFDEPMLIERLAVVDWYDGALESALTGFEDALANGVPRDLVLQGLGQVRVELGDFEQGVADLTEVIDGPGDYLARAYARSSRALGLGGLGLFDEALEELRAVERTTEDNAWLHFNRARVLEWHGDPAAAASYVRSLVCSDPALNRPKRMFAQQRLKALGWSV